MKTCFFWELLFLSFLCFCQYFLSWHNNIKVACMFAIGTRYLKTGLKRGNTFPCPAIKSSSISSKCHFQQPKNSAYTGKINIMSIWHCSHRCCQLRHTFTPPMFRVLWGSAINWLADGVKWAPRQPSTLGMDKNTHSREFPCVPSLNDRAKQKVPLPPTNPSWCLSMQKCRISVEMKLLMASQLLSSFLAFQARNVPAGNLWPFGTFNVANASPIGADAKFGTKVMRAKKTRANCV